MKKIFALPCLLISTTVILFSCSSSGDTIPPAPANSKEVQQFVKGKKLQTAKTGFYGNLTVNGKTEVEWIDAAKTENKFIKEAVEEQKDFVLQFTDDTTVVVFTKDTSYTGTYKADDEADQYDDGRQGVKLRITYVDPSFTFGNSEPSPVTYTYFVLGLDEKRLLLELPRDINRRKLVSLFSE